MANQKGDAIMSKELQTFPLSDIDRIEIYINTDQLTIRQIVEKEKPDLAIEGTFYLGSWEAACHLKADGKVLSNDPSYSTDGYAWDIGPDIKMCRLPYGAGSQKANHITGCRLIVDGKPCDPLYYNQDVGGARGRGGFGLKGDNILFYACTDGVDALTPEQFRDKMAAFGCDSFVMGDGGGKVNFYNRATGTLIEGRDKSQNLILVYMKNGGEKPVSDKKYKVCLDPGHGPGCVNGDPDGIYKEHEFAMDMANRVSGHLKRCGISVVMTRDENGYPSVMKRCKISNNVKADLLVSLHSNAAGSDGWNDASGLIVFTSAPPLAARRNVAACKLLGRFREAGVNVREIGLAHNIKFAVLRVTKAPACLIEYGFHTNREDVQRLKDSFYRDKLAVATAKGICDFLGIKYMEETVLESKDTGVAEWAITAWNRATARHVMDGTRPTEPFTRQELAVVLDRLNLI